MRLVTQFYYPINLHYSQTLYDTSADDMRFYYPINLHYSQTTVVGEFQHTTFYYPINLHYSQTNADIFGYENCFTTL